MREQISERGLAVVKSDENQVTISIDSVAYTVNCIKSLQKDMLRELRYCLSGELLRDGDLDDISPVLCRRPSFMTMAFPNDDRLGENVRKWFGGQDVAEESFGLVHGAIGLLELNDIDCAWNDVFGAEKDCFLMCGTEADSDGRVVVSIWS